MMVPPDWIAGADAAPVHNDDGTQQPRIAATTDPALSHSADIEDWFGVPGVIYRALPLETDTAAHLEATVYNDYCTPEPLQGYDDGIFTGHIQAFNNCAGTATRVVEVVANPADAAFTAVVEIQLTGQPTTRPRSTACSRHSTGWAATPPLQRIRHCRQAPSATQRST